MKDADHTKHAKPLDARALAKVQKRQEAERRKMRIRRTQKEATVWDEMNAQFHEAVKEVYIREGTWEDLVGKPGRTAAPESGAKEKVQSYVLQKWEQEWKNNPPTLKYMTDKAWNQYKNQLVNKNGKPYTRSAVMSWIRELKLHNPDRGRR
jgi:hypothetical protein